MDEIEREVSKLCAELRAVAGLSSSFVSSLRARFSSHLTIPSRPTFAAPVPLVDAFALSDHIINSPLGRYDGQIYEAYFDQVRRANPLPKGAS
jgi:hypothetical protein